MKVCEMRVVLIYLPHPYLVQSGQQAPIGLLYLGAILDQQGFDVKVKNYTSFLTHEAITDLPEADVYGITTTCLELLQANRFAHLIKEKYHSCKVVLGGPGTYSYEYVDWNVIDSICIGEAEITILEMLSDIGNKSLKRIYNGKPVKDLDTISFPARYLLEGGQGGKIFAWNKEYKYGGSTVIVTSRGCPFKCAFCSSPYFTEQGCGVRFRSPENVYDEFKHVVDTYGVRQFRFSDDMFTANKDHTYKVCKLLEELDIVWRLSMRVKPFDYSLAQAMFDAGCVEMSFGVESFDTNVLNLLKKGITPEDSIKALKICRDVGITTRVLFMIRTPGQTKKTVPTNIEWLEKASYDMIACKPFVPMPASDIWNNPDKYGIEIINKNLDDYNFYFYGKYGENELKDVVRIKGRSLEEINQETQDFLDYLKSTNKLNKG